MDVRARIGLIGTAMWIGWMGLAGSCGGDAGPSTSPASTPVVNCAYIAYAGAYDWTSASTAEGCGCTIGGIEVVGGGTPQMCAEIPAGLEPKTCDQSMFPSTTCCAKAGWPTQGYCDCEASSCNGTVVASCTPPSSIPWLPLCSGSTGTGGSSGSGGSGGTTGWGTVSTCQSGASVTYQCCAISGSGCDQPSQYQACCEDLTCASGQGIACLAAYEGDTLDYNTCAAIFSACGL
jgi:hypothetical protein